MGLEQLFACLLCRGKDAKREHGLLSWMNSELAPMSSSSDSCSSSADESHSVRRVLGDVASKAYVTFKRDEAFAALAAKIEQRICARQLLIKDPVRVSRVLAVALPALLLAAFMPRLHAGCYGAKHSFRLCTPAGFDTA